MTDSIQIKSRYKPNDEGSYTFEIDIPKEVADAINALEKKHGPNLHKFERALYQSALGILVYCFIDNSKSAQELTNRFTSMSELSAEVVMMLKNKDFEND